MPNINADEIVLMRHKRNFVQYGGARVDHPVLYAGQNAQYLKISGVSNPESGDIEPIWVHDPQRPGKFRLVGRSKTAPDLAEATLTFMEKHGSIPRHLANTGCLTVYENTGACKDLSDPISGWDDYVLIYADGQVTDRDLGDRSAWGDDDSQIEVELTVVWSDIFAVGALSFGEKLPIEVERDVIDLVYGTAAQCNGCDTPESYTDRLYAVTRPSGAGSPGTPTEVVYTTDGGSTTGQMNITGLGANATPSAIDIVGRYLVVVVPEEGAYYYTPINSLTGVPETTWTKVTSGFVANKNPNDIYVVGTGEVYFAADGGYIYKSTDITSGVSVLNAAAATTADLQRIHGQGDVIVAVGESGAIVKSVNRGATFATVTLSPTSATIRAVAVKSTTEFWIGTSGGLVYVTINGGETWTQKGFSGLSVVDDIVFVNNNVGYVAGRTSTPAARLFSTWDGGVNWTRDRERILNFPTFNYINRIAIPTAADATTASNNIAVGGLSGGGTDGVIYYGIASKL